MATVAMGRTTYLDNANPFVANEHSLVHDTGRQIDWASVPDSFRRGSFTVEVTTNAAADATSVLVVALPGDLPNGTILQFGADKYVTLTAAATAGDTTLTVEALTTALVDGDLATYGAGGDKSIPAGTIMAELASGMVIPVSAAAAETATHIIESTVNEGDETAHVGSGMLVGGVIYENLLPDFADGSFATWQGELEAAGVGIGWKWATYADDTV